MRCIIDKGGYMIRLLLFLSFLLNQGCMTIYECEGDHKEQYNNISPTTQASTTDTTGKTDTSNNTNTPQAK